MNPSTIARYAKYLLIILVVMAARSPNQKELAAVAILHTNRGAPIRPSYTTLFIMARFTVQNVKTLPAQNWDSLKGSGHDPPPDRRADRAGRCSGFCRRDLVAMTGPEMIIIGLLVGQYDLTKHGESLPWLLLDIVGSLSSIVLMGVGSLVLIFG